MVWKKCGYVSLTKDGKKVSVVVKHIRYVVSLDEVKAVLDGTLGFAGVFEPPVKEDP